MDTPTVVLLHPHGHPMAHARQRAEQMALVLGARLLILQPSHTALPTRVLFPHASHDDGLRWLSEQAHRARVVERWSRSREKRGLGEIEVERCEGSLAALLEVTHRPGVELFVMPWTCASWLTAVCTESPVPVLVAHRARATERVLAASNLEHPDRPVLRVAIGLARRLHSALTVVHNRPALATQLVALGLLGEVATLPEEPGTQGQERALRREVRALGSVARVSVTRRLDPAAGILEAASEDDVDLIVIGSPAHHSTLFADRVAERLCALSERSVLVVPT